MTDSSSAEAATVTETTTPATTPDVAQTSGTDVKTTEVSSTPEKDSGATSMLEAVKTALKPSDKKEQSPGSQTQDSKAADPAEKSDELPEEVTPEELADQKPKTKKRIEQLLGKVKTLGTELEGVKGKAQNFDQMVDFVKRAGLSPDELNTGMDIMHLMKKDPLKAFERLQPIFSQLQAIVGEVLPTDLQDSVRQGFITEEHARELARTRSKAAISDARLQENEQASQQEQAQQKHQAFVSQVATAASSWERATAAADPDWHLKANRVNALIENAILKGWRPADPNETVAKLKEIHEGVTAELKQLNPTPRPIQRVTGQSSARSATEPKTMLEAIQSSIRAA